MMPRSLVCRAWVLFRYIDGSASRMQSTKLKGGPFSLQAGGEDGVSEGCLPTLSAGFYLRPPVS
jgi:hypothetical protein